jgi:hypothetical protein
MTMAPACCYNISSYRLKSCAKVIESLGRRISIDSAFGEQAAILTRIRISRILRFWAKPFGSP